MQIPLVVDPNDYRWKLLREILKVFEMRKAKRIIAKFTSPVGLAAKLFDEVLGNE